MYRSLRLSSSLFSFVGLLCAILCNLGGMSSPAWSQENFLLRRATKVADATDLGLEQDENFWLPDYFEGGNLFWISSDELLVRHAVAGKPKGADEARKMGWFRHNLKTGKEVFLDKLSALYDQTDGESVSTLSPDGKWLLWTGLVNNPRKGAEEPVYIHCAIAARLDGSASVQWLDTTAGYWANDSRHWLLFGFSLVSGYDVNKPKLIRRIALWEGNPLNDHHDASGHPIVDPLVVLSDKQILTNSWNYYWPRLPAELSTYSAKFYNTYKTYKMDLHKHGAILQEYSFALPINAWVRECRFSPSGDYIAWIFEFKPGKMYLKATTDLWISRMDGSDLHEIGPMDTVPSIEMVDPYHPYALRWLPDGKHISLVYKNAILVVPVE